LSGNRGLLMTAAIGLVAIMELRVMATLHLADRWSGVKCPFGHVGFSVPLPDGVQLQGEIGLRWRLRSSSPESAAMTFLLILLIGGFAIAAATALIRGLMAFFRDGEHFRQNGNAPREAFGVQQNRMMTQRVLFQGIAILLIALFGALAGRN
jgi:hypothetical protein